MNQCRGSLAGAAIVFALLSLRPADAQFFVAPSPPRQPGPLLGSWAIDVHHEIADRARAEWHLQHAQAKRGLEPGQCGSAAADLHRLRIEKLENRIVIDDWLIRKITLQDPGWYPYPVCMDPMSRAALAQYHEPPQGPYLRTVPTQGLGPAPVPMAGAPKISITIVNAEPAGSGVAFAIDGVAYQAAGGSRQELSVAPDSNITYDGGGSLGQRQYRISPGLYEFRSTSEGWALYRLPGMP